MSDASQVTEGEGYALGHIDALGEGYGFRKVRSGLGVTAFGANVIVMPPGYQSGFHSHERQEELYFVHRGTMEFHFGDGSVHEAGPGTAVLVKPETVRGFRATGDEDVVYLVVGGAGGYVGRDGRQHESLDAPGTTGGEGAPGAG